MEAKLNLSLKRMKTKQLECTGSARGSIIAIWGRWDKGNVINLCFPPFVLLYVWYKDTSDLLPLFQRSGWTRAELDTQQHVPTPRAHWDGGGHSARTTQKRCLLARVSRQWWLAHLAVPKGSWGLGGRRAALQPARGSWKTWSAHGSRAGVGDWCWLVSANALLSYTESINTHVSLRVASYSFLNAGKEIIRASRSTRGKQESLCNWCLKVSWSLLHRRVWLTGGPGERQPQVRELQWRVRASETFPVWFQAHESSSEDVETRVHSQAGFFHLSDLSQLHKGEIILQLNLGFCSKFCFGMTQDYSLPRVR